MAYKKSFLLILLISALAYRDTLAFCPRISYHTIHSTWHILKHRLVTPQRITPHNKNLDSPALQHQKKYFNADFKREKSIDYSKAEDVWITVHASWRAQPRVESNGLLGGK